MKPILYESTETLFATNGLGRLRDTISCVVTEERNGIYECDFEYPVDGSNYDLIRPGRIIGVTHNQTEDIQPFDIVSFSRPIDGVVTFHAVHISYRQSHLVCTGSNVQTLASALALLETAVPTNPFSYETNKIGSGYLAAADGIPHTVKSMLGGMEGSILDVYGGEYEWDKWTVRLWTARGVMRNFTIRYGVNMLNYDEDYDISETYSSCVPYWTNGSNKVVGTRVDSTGQTITGRGECVPLDVSDRFESQPTAAQVTAIAATIMNEQNPFLPTQSIKVEFLRLNDVGYEQFENLFECNLCDTIPVVFPYYGVTGTFKIVKTEWNVLEDRYESMELGSLQTTLEQALGL